MSWRYLWSCGHGFGPQLCTVCGAAGPTTSGPASAKRVSPLPAGLAEPSADVNDPDAFWPVADDCDDSDHCDDCVDCVDCVAWSWALPAFPRDCVWVF
jgi:hypothetical protein